ncbi:MULTISPECIES: hypothetical protein [unclassified Pseudomonas]|uniref:hypothetical protein n=1 Tax=unclassified Pseudomonas TaxID=196821 RepID=UPI0021157F5E|nr:MULTISPECIES: hypothetical protein [unclassified Pseudomonas]
MVDPRNELHLCASHYIQAVEAVRGQGAALQLLREFLCLNAHAEIVHAQDINAYFLRLDDVDRWSNKRVGMLDAVATTPFKSVEAFRAEIATWTPQDYAHVHDTTGLDALIKLGLPLGN